MITTRVKLVIDFAAAAMFGLAVATAQTAAPLPSSSTGRADLSGDREVVTLSPFVISTDKDTGYIAADTVSAGRLSTNLLMTPGGIDVLTRDLLNDLGVFNIDEASAWLTSSRPLELGAIESNGMNPGSLSLSESGSNVQLRGFAAQPSTRNYFQSASTPQEYNVDRLESVRGPNAILYGEGGPGGQVNYITKRAKNRNFATVRLRTDSHWSKGAALDINRKLTDQVFFRYNFNVLDENYHISRNKFRNIGNSVNFVVLPFERTTVSVDVDLTRTSRPGLIMSYGEQYTRWNKVPVTRALTTAEATAAGLQNWATTTRNVWVEGLGMLNLGGLARTVGYGLPAPTEYEYAEHFPNIMAPPSRSFNANPTQVNVVDHATDLQIAVDHVFRNQLSVQVAAQYSKYTNAGGNYFFGTLYQDPLANLPDGRANPNFGKLFAYSYVGRIVDAERTGKTVRLVTAYPLKFWGGTTNLSAFLQRQQQDTTTVYSDLHIVEPNSTTPITDNSSLIYVFRYLDNLTPSLPDFSKMYNTRLVPVSDGRIKNQADALMVAASGSYLRDSLSYIAGFRRDKSDLTTQNGDVASRDRVTGEIARYTIEPRVAFNNTTTFGLVYFPLRYMGVFGNHAEGFQIQTIAAPRLDGSFARANIVPAKDSSAGLRFRFDRWKEVKIVGSIGYYKVEQNNSAFSVGVGNINQLWFYKNLTNRYISTFDQNPLSTGSGNSITSARSFNGWGWEASLTANVGNAWRFTFNAAIPRTKQSDVGADYLKYVKASMPEWLPLLSDPVATVSSTSQTYINQINQTIDNFQEGRAQNYTYKNRYNLLGVYTFQRSPVKGLRAGLGAQFFGPMIIGNELDRPFDYVYRKSNYLLSGSLGYTFKVKRQRFDVQLNVDNLLDYDKPLVNGLFVQTSATTGARVNIPYGFKYAWPRAARLTLTVPF